MQVPFTECTCWLTYERLLTLSIHSARVCASSFGIAPLLTTHRRATCLRASDWKEKAPHCQNKDSPAYAGSFPCLLERTCWLTYERFSTDSARVCASCFGIGAFLSSTDFCNVFESVRLESESERRLG